MKNERKSTNNPTTALLSLISETKSIKEATIKSNIVVPKSGCIKIKNILIKTPDIANNLLAFWLSILAINNTKIILLNSDGCIKIGNPSGSKSYHRLTPSIGVVKSKPNKTEIERKNNEFIKLYKFSIERYVVKKNTINPTNENTICLVRMLFVVNSIDSIELNKVNHEITLNNINWSSMYKFVPSGPNIVIFRFIIQ